MWQTIRSISSLLFSFAMLMLGQGMINTLLGLRSRIEGFSTETTGLIMTGQFVGMLIGAVFAIRVIAAVGHIRSFAAFASILSVAVLAHVLFADPIFWFFLRIVTGFCMAGMIMVVESWVNEKSSNENRGKILSLYMITNYIGSGSGQFMMLLGDPAQFQLFVIASMVYSFALVPLLLTRATAPTPSSPKRMAFKKLFLVSPVGVFGTVCAGMSNSSLNSMGAVFGKDVGLTIPQISTFMAAAIFGGMLLQFPIGRISDRFDRRTVLIVSSLLTIGSCFAVIWATGQSFIILIAAIAIYGGMSFTIYPISASQVNDMADRKELVQVSAGLLIAYGVGASLGPTVAAQFMAFTGPEGIFMFFVLNNSLLVIFTIIRIFQRQRHVENKAPFLPLGGNGMSSKQLYTAAIKAETSVKKETNTEN
ncbi:MFS transporter [Kiloniella sp. EL199]|uniref:MFS transporter n=1 Tax=Kiloniella sp. EL199 TaxID=2107581 RepID=UPI000EA0BCDC|nr:MFS transporter [Kiloniella sp. EL199]